MRDGENVSLDKTNFSENKMNQKNNYQLHFEMVVEYYRY